MPIADFSQTLAQQGLEITGTDPDTGFPIVLHKESGKTGVFNPQEYSHATTGQYIPPDVQFQFNTPENPVQAPAVSLVERTALETLYDDKTKAQALMKRFDEVIPTEKNGLVVKKNGVYQTYDPQFLNTLNPRELAEGFVEGIPRAVLAGAMTAAAGAAIGATAPGLLVGAGLALAGGLAAGTIRTSFGRFMGTYNASDEERLRDVGLEGLFNMGGALFLPGRKPQPKQVIQAMEKVSGASETVKGTAAAVFGKLTGAGTAPTRTLIEESPAVIQAIKQNVAAAGKNTDKAINLSVEKAADAARGWLQQGVDKLPQEFKKALETAAKDAGEKNFTSDIAGLISKTKRSLEELNLGRFDDAKAQTTGKVRTVLRQLNEKELAEAGVARPDEQTWKVMERLSSLLGAYQNDGTMKGEVAFRRLANLNKELNRIKYSLPSDASPEMVSTVNRAVGAFKQHLGQEFADKGVGDAWIAANKQYTQYSKAVDMARDLLKSKEGVHQFLDRIGGKAGKQRSSGELAGQLAQLIGPEGDGLWKEMAVNYAASKFVPVAPHLGIAQLGAANVAAGLHSIPVAVGATVASSPRAVAHGTNAVMTPIRKAMPYVEKFQQAMQRMSPEDRQLFLQNPTYIEGMYNNMMSAMASEDAHTQSLLQGAQAQINNTQSGQSNGQPGR